MNKFIVLLLLISTNCFAIDFFEEPISWDEKKKVSKKAKKRTEKQPSVKKENNFSWDNYLNPRKNPEEFFREGDHVPPKPAIETALNPTDENIKKWFAYNKLKNDITSKFKLRLREYMLKNRPSMDKAGSDYLEKKINSMPSENVVAKNFKFRMYFDSKCPHCKRMFTTLKQLQNNGYYVEVIQIDNDVAKGVPFPIIKASQQEVKTHKIKSVPTTLVADLKRKALLPPMVGYQSYESVQQYLAKATALRKNGGINEK